MQGPVVCDIAGLTLTQDDVRRISHRLVGMVILFSRNYENPTQLKALCDAIHAVKPEVLISVDHEGGRVQRFRQGFTEIPAMSTYGKAYLKNQNAALRAAESAGYVLASELRSLGVDFTFAPVLDLDWGRSAIIGERSFGAAPETVAAVAGAVIQGFKRAGMANCGKHFPGHGYAEADSHVALPVDDRAAQRIIDMDCRPYRLLGDDLTSLMTAHVAYPMLDNAVATFSKKLVTEILRDRFGFKGLVFSDDLSMKGAMGAGSIVERSQKALAAGCDMLIVCNAPETVDELLRGLTWTESEVFKQRAGRLKPTGTFMSRDALLCDGTYLRAKEIMFSVF